MSSSFTLYGIDIEQLRRAVSQSPAVHSADSLKALCTAKGELVQLDLLEHSEVLPMRWAHFSPG